MVKFTDLLSPMRGPPRLTSGPASQSGKRSMASGGSAGQGKNGGRAAMMDRGRSTPGQLRQRPFSRLDTVLDAP